MQVYLVMRRFFHRGVMQKVGSKINLNPSDAARLSYSGYVSGPVKSPRRSRKRRKNAVASK